MQFDLRAMLAKESSCAHDRASCPNSGNEGVRSERMIIKLPPNLGSSGLLVCLDIRFVCELRRQKNMWLMQGQFFGHANAAQEAPLILADAHDLRSQAS